MRESVELRDGWKAVPTVSNNIRLLRPESSPSPAAVASEGSLLEVMLVKESIG